LRAVADAVSAESGRQGFHRFATISLAEDLMMPTAMLYRNLMAMEVEEMLRSHP
jgi:dihydroxy-acid dehydratase